MEKLSKINEITKDGFFVKDYVVGLSEESFPSWWTSDLAGDGYYAAQYQNFSVDTETGECKGGVWNETGAPAKSKENPSEKMSTLMAEASVEIAPLQDAADLEIATDDEKLRLKMWKNYRVELMRTDITSEEIIWPEIPS